MNSYPVSGYPVSRPSLPHFVSTPLVSYPSPRRNAESWQLIALPSEGPNSIPMRVLESVELSGRPGRSGGVITSFRRRNDGLKPVPWLQVETARCYARSGRRCSLASHAAPPPPLSLPTDRHLIISLLFPLPQRAQTPHSNG